MLWMMVASASPGPFAGTWVLADPERARGSIETAVEAGAQRFNFAIRGLARSKLRKACALDTSITIDGEPGQVQMDYQGENPRVGGGPSDGTMVKIRSSDVTYTRRGNTLTVHGKNENGGKVSVYTVDGSTMAVTHTLESSRLGDPLSWTLHYRKN